jgi:cysteine synthase
MENSPDPQYRDLLAKRLREAHKGRPRKALLSRERATSSYGRAFQRHAARTRTGLSYERSLLYQSLESQIGNTPLVELSEILPNSNRLFIKHEYDNPVGHSHYDRVYLSLLKEKERLGLIKPGMNLFETTSGTAGVSFAAIGRELGYKCHVAIPAGGERAREKAIEKEGAQLYLTPAEEYVNGFTEFIRIFSRAHPDYVFVNHSMGNILGKGYDVNETAIHAMHAVADEISSQLKQLGALKLDFLMSALGNGTNTLGLGKRLKIIEPEAKLCAYETVLSGVGYSIKYGASKYRRLLDIKERFSATAFVRHNMPGTSYPGIDFPAARKALSFVDRVVLIADTFAEREYVKVTGNELPEEVVKTEFGKSQKYGRSTEAGIAVAQSVAARERDKNFVVIGYDTADRYDHPMVANVTGPKIAVFGGQGKFGTALQRRLELTNVAAQITATVDKRHNSEIAFNSDLIVLAVQPGNVASLLREISPALKSDAKIVSFVARYPLQLVRESAERPVARAMADPWWNVSALMPGAGCYDDDFHGLFEGLTKTKTIVLKTDREMDEFTVAISHTFVALLGQRLGVIKDADEHLQYIAPRIGLPRIEIEKFLPEDEPTELMSLAVTKGGISQAMMIALEKEPSMKPCDLFSRGLADDLRPAVAVQSHRPLRAAQG